MVTNASFHRLQILVGDDNQDWSSALISFEAGDSERDDSGLITTRGKLVLGFIQGAPDSMNPRSAAGKARWFKGQKIVVNVTNSGGVFVRHPRGWMYVSKPPLPPTPDKPYLELELADVLQFRSYPQPRGLVAEPEYQYTDSSPTGVGAILRNAAIETALEKAGIVNEYVGSVGQYPIASPLYHTGDGGYVQFAGAISFGGIETLYQRNDGKIDSVSLAMQPPSSPIATVELGKDELLWECTEGGEPPVEVVNYQGNFTGLQPANQGDPNSGSTSIDYGPGSMVDPALGSQQIKIRQTTRSEVSNNQYKSSTVTIFAPLGLVSQDAFLKSTTLGLESKSTTESFYDVGDGGRLQKTVYTERSLFPKSCSSAFRAMSPADKANFAGYEIVSKITETTYEYDPFTGITQKITAITQEPQAAIAADEDFSQPADLVPSERVVTSWKENKKGDWTQIVITDQSLARIPDKEFTINTSDADLRASIKLTLTRKSYQEDSSNTGQTTPPAAERAPVQFETYDIPIQGVAKFTAPKGPFNERERTYTLEVGCVSVAQLQELAQIKGAELFGRAQGARIQLPLRDEFLNNPEPLNYLAVIEPELLPTQRRKNIGLYQLDAMQYTHGEGQAVVTASLIWMGTQQGELVDYE